MKQTISYIATCNGIAAVIDGEQYTITSDNPSYNQVLDAIIAGERPERIAELFRTANPSKRSTEELYKFLEHKAMPITPDGCFLAYKGVNDNYTDVHSGRFSNRPGVTNSMPRQKVDDDFRNGCSYGFHVGSLEYATSWGSRTVIVKVDPADVVSVPSDCNCQKLRTSKYTVVCDYKGKLGENLADADSPYRD
jgi:hypothetical protein